MLTPTSIVCFGEMLWDMLPSGQQPAGTPWQIARQLAQLGQAVQLVSRVGNDVLGHELLACSRQSGLDLRLVQCSETHLTGVVKATGHPTQTEASKIPEPVAWDCIQHTEDLRTSVTNSALLVYSSLAARNATSRETLYRLLPLATCKVFAVALRPPYYTRTVVNYLLRQADVVKLNEKELHEIMRGLGQPLDETTALPWLAQHFHLQAVCLTKGEQGAVLWHQGQRYTASQPVSCEDTFLAAFLVGWLQGQLPAEMLRRACIAAAPRLAYITSRQPDLQSLTLPSFP